MRTPFCIGCRLFDKESRAEYSRQYKADGHDLFVTSHAYGAPRPPQGASEKHEDVKQFGSLRATTHRQDNETPLQLQPERATIFRWRGVAGNR